MIQDFLLPAHGLVKEPELSFHPDRHEDKHVNPIVGLSQFGPYSRSLINRVIDPIRIAFIVPKGADSIIKGLLTEIEAEHAPIERLDYLVRFPGFSHVFGLRLVLAQSSCQVHLPPNLDSEIANSKSPHIILGQHLTSAIRQLQAARSSFDLLMIYLPAVWEDCFFREHDDFDLHDYIKATTASSAIPTQILNETGALAYPCRASVMWRLSIALYCKAGGVPWKITDFTANTAHIGLSYSVRLSESGLPRFITCCSQVFDADGAGLEFLAYATSDVQIDRENPFLNRSDMRRVMARSLSLYQRRHAGRIPSQVVVHKSTEFKPSEIDGCFDAWKSSEGLDLLHVQQYVSWRGILIQPPSPSNTKGKPGAYPCQRGSFLQIGGRDLLLWTQGNAPAAAGGKNFYKEGKGIPRPILLRRFAGHGSWSETCRSVMALTKMNWNNDSLYDRLPVTMSYAKALARTMKRMPTLSPRPYEFRFFL